MSRYSDDAAIVTSHWAEGGCPGPFPPEVPIARSKLTTGEWCHVARGALASARAMHTERAERIRDSGDIPDFYVIPFPKSVSVADLASMNFVLRNPEIGAEKIRTVEHFKKDFWLSYKQFAKNLLRAKENRSLVQYETEDGITPFPPEEIEMAEFSAIMQRVKQRDRRIVDSLIEAGASPGQVMEFSKLLATDPVSREVLRNRVEEIFGSEVPDPVIEEFELGEEVEEREQAPETPSLEEILAAAPAIPKRPDLPVSEANLPSPEEYRELILREARRRIQDAPEYVMSAQDKAAKESALIADYNYWRNAHPTVNLLPGDNPYVDPKRLRRPIDEGESIPVVNVEIIPRQKEKPDKPFLGEIGKYLSPILSAIPVVGPALSAGVGVVTAMEMQNWAEDWEVPASAFAPQYEPQAFTVPLPLDRAKLAVEQPWYVPALVKTFQEDIKQRRVRSLDQIWQILQAKDSANLELPDSIFADAGSPPEDQEESPASSDPIRDDLERGGGLNDFLDDLLGGGSRFNEGGESSLTGSNRAKESSVGPILWVGLGIGLLILMRR